MKLGNVEFKQPRHPRILVAVIAVPIALVILVSIYRAIFVQSIDPSPGPPPQPSLVPQKLASSNYEQTRHRFGPWQLATPGSNGAPHLVMLLDGGGLDVSATIIHVNKMWQPALASEIVSVKPGKRTVKIGVGMPLPFVYQLRYGQAFILAQRPDAVYGYLADGPGRAKLVGTTVQALKKP